LRKEEKIDREREREIKRDYSFSALLFTKVHPNVKLLELIIPL